ncbi:MAG: type VI secretion system baseplate subunit TssE [Desulfamplus sp.]|nr:type VI secretion system baseplate subunit TssE [Desulfamplus sp.]
MSYHDFLEKLAQSPLYPLEKGENYNNDIDGETLSIRNNLLVILNTRQGTLPHLADYGLPDISDAYSNLSDYKEILRQAITQCIRLYEPRLTDVKVSEVKSEEYEFHVTYRIEAVIASLSGKSPVKFKSQVKSDGKVVLN